MLVLTRKQDETIVIAGQIEIEVLQIKGNKVRLGLTAPANVQILRGELSPNPPLGEASGVGQVQGQKQFEGDSWSIAGESGLGNRESVSESPVEYRLEIEIPGGLSRVG